MKPRRIAIAWLIPLSVGGRVFSPMQILRQEAVEYVFGIPGATEAHFVDAFEDYPEIKYVLCLNEAVATAMAEGYARVG